MKLNWRLLIAAASLVPVVALAQTDAATCARLVGSWAGEWSQGYYGRQWIHVTGVTAGTAAPDACVAQVAYAASADIPRSTAAIPVVDGVMTFTCNSGTAGTCRLELRGDELHARYSDPSGFINQGVFRKAR